MVTLISGFDGPKFFICKIKKKEKFFSWIYLIFTFKLIPSNATEQAVGLNLAPPVGPKMLNLTTSPATPAAKPGPLASTEDILDYCRSKF